jgi:Flp pilus assembly protein CpaB
MKKSLFIILGLAALAGILTLALLTGIVVPQTVIVTRYDLAAGTRLTAELLEERRLPKAAVPEGAYSSIEDPKPPCQKVLIRLSKKWPAKS